MFVPISAFSILSVGSSVTDLGSQGWQNRILWAKCAVSNQKRLKAGKAIFCCKKKKTSLRASPCTQVWYVGSKIVFWSFFLILLLNTVLLLHYTTASVSPLLYWKKVCLVVVYVMLWPFVWDSSWRDHGGGQQLPWLSRKVETQKEICYSSYVGGDWKSGSKSVAAIILLYWLWRSMAFGKFN